MEKLIKNVKLNLSEEEMESNLIRIFFYIHIFWLNIKIIYVYVVPVRNWVLKDTLGGEYIPFTIHCMLVGIIVYAICPSTTFLFYII